MLCVLNNLKKVPTLSKHLLNNLASQKRKAEKNPKPENITEEIREKEAEKIAFRYKKLLMNKLISCAQGRDQYTVSVVLQTFRGLNRDIMDIIMQKRNN